jgi:threonine aldolase
MTQEEFIDAILGCTRYLADHYPRSVSHRMQDIAESPYSEHRSDNYGNGGFIRIFEQEVADLLGKEAAVFMPSGTMAQPIALRIWADRAKNQNVAFHPMCHLQKHEHMAYQELHHLNGVLLGEAGRLFTLEDLKSVQEEIATLLIELPQRDLGGQLPTWNELQTIVSYARSKEMKLHLDGARLWECQPFYHRTYEEIVADFDSVYVSFYKILHGLPGAALAGPADFIAEARIWMRRHGGNLQTMFPNAISAKIGMDRHLHRIPEYVAKAQEISGILNNLKGVMAVPNPAQTNMMHLWFDAEKDALLDASGQIARREKVLLIQNLNDVDGWRKTEISIGEAALDLPNHRIRELFSEILEIAKTP